MQGVKFKPKEEKAKHGLKIRPKISIFCMGRLGHYCGQKKKERREEEKKRRRRKSRFGTLVWNSCLELFFCLELLYMLVWNLCMGLLVRKPP